MDLLRYRHLIAQFAYWAKRLEVESKKLAEQGQK